MVVELTKSTRTPQAVLYYCQSCSTNFSDHLEIENCPECDTTEGKTMVKIYIEDDPELDNMYTKTDWLAGD